MTATTPATRALRQARVSTDLGEITLVADGDVLTGLYFAQHWPRPPRTAFGSLVDADADRFLSRVSSELGEYLAGRRTTFDVPTSAVGDDFQLRVWAVLGEIPYGTTTTYGAIADRLGDKALAQRVGQAVGRNPLSIVVPCHRVVGSDGWLTGYAGGLDRKRRLLDLEEPADARVGRLF
jgi:methylated-DNA-[protein]-cysteine S-methyltransferase